MAVTTHIRHPLAPLTPEEIASAVAIVREEYAQSEHFRFVMVRLHEPTPHTILSYQSGATVVREVFLSLLDKTLGKSAAYEAIRQSYYQNMAFCSIKMACMRQITSTSSVSAWSR